MRSPTHILLLSVLVIAAGCSKEPPPRSVAELVENELLLEAALVRCTQNRAEMRYEAECINAREAVNIIEAREDAERRAELEAQSEAKREALRRTQEAAAEARRRAAAAQRQREEAEYLAQFGEVPAGDDQVLEGNAPGAVIPRDAEVPNDPSGGYETGGVYVSPYEAPYQESAAALPTAGSNAPSVETQAEPTYEPLPEAEPERETVVEAEPEPETVVEAEPEPDDLQSIRDELRRRNGDGTN